MSSKLNIPWDFSGLLTRLTFPMTFRRYHYFRRFRLTFRPFLRAPAERVRNNFDCRQTFSNKICKRSLIRKELKSRTIFSEFRTIFCRPKCSTESTFDVSAIQPKLVGVLLWRQEMVDVLRLRTFLSWRLIFWRAFWLFRRFLKSLFRCLMEEALQLQVSNSEN